jgi:peptidoglycan/LPS O-acetylase OafA/YrhL
MLEWETLRRFSGLDWIGTRETLIDNIYSIIVILAFLYYDKVKYPNMNLVSNLGTKSYGIYLIHAPVLALTAKVIYHLLPGLLAYQFLFVPTIISVALGVPLLLMMSVNKSPVRRSYNYLFG